MSQFEKGQRKQNPFNASSGILTKMPPKALHLLLGEVVTLLMSSELHRKYLINDIGSVLLPPLHLNQFRIYKTGDRPVGLITWARLTEEIEKKYLTGNYNLRPEDWNSGDKGWIIDFVAPFGNMKEITEDLRRNIFPDEVGKAIRVDSEGLVMGVVKLHGINRVGEVGDVDLKCDWGAGTV